MHVIHCVVQHLEASTGILTVLCGVRWVESRSLVIFLWRSIVQNKLKIRGRLVGVSQLSTPFG